MQITAPFGYGEIVPLQKQHRVRLPAGNTPAFCRNLNAIAVSGGEFVIAQRDYPIVFASLDEGRSFAPVVVLGLAEHENLFVDAHGEWDAACYVPAFVRRYPFCLSKLYVDGEPSGERLVCVATACVDDDGVALFGSDGEPTATWRDLESMLAEYETELDLTAQMSAALATLGLLVPFSMQAFETDSPGIRLAGMYRIDEARLRDLRAASVKMLLEKQFMGRIYAHLHSLENFQRLYARQVAARRGN